MQGAQVLSLVRELRSLQPWGAAKKKKNSYKTTVQKKKDYTSSPGLPSLKWMLFFAATAAAEKGLLQRHSRRQEAYALKALSSPKGFRKALLKTRW